MKTFLLLLAGGLVFSALTAGICWSHGVDGYAESANGYCITAMYDDGEPMSYAAVEIQAPDSKNQFQTGRTDRNGCFMIRPDEPGRWQAVVKDGMGHRLSVDLEVEDRQAAPQNHDAVHAKASGGMNRPTKILTGLSIIFGLSGFLYGWQARRRQAPPGQKK